MKKEQASREEAIQIIEDVIREYAPKKKKAKKFSKLTETDIDIFAEDEKEQ